MNHSKANGAKITSSFEDQHFRVGIVSIDRLLDLKRYLEGLHVQGLLYEKLYKERLIDFDFYPKKRYTNAKSIIIATIKQPIVQVKFMYRGTLHKAIIPPTYSNLTDKVAIQILENILEPEGLNFSRIILPEKLLLGFSGIAKYGRNNIAYVEGMGSFHRPVVFVTDAELEETKWIHPEKHEKCNQCRACIKYCPTKAISEERFLIKAEKCITYYNESESPFPESIKPEYHNCLIGCMICQNVCPLNKDYIDNIENILTFSEQETEEILANTPKSELSESVTDKLKMINLFEEYNLLSRNLSVLLKTND